MDARKVRIGLSQSLPTKTLSSNTIVIENENEIEALLKANTIINGVSYTRPIDINELDEKLDYGNNLTKINILMNFRIQYQCPQITFSFKLTQDPYKISYENCKKASKEAEEKHKKLYDIPECDLSKWMSIEYKNTHCTNANEQILKQDNKQ